MEIVHISYVENHEAEDDNGKLWRWETDAYYRCPWPITKRGVPFKRYPSEKSTFWQAVENEKKVK